MDKTKLLQNKLNLTNPSDEEKPLTHKYTNMSQVVNPNQFALINKKQKSKSSNNINVILNNENVGRTHNINSIIFRNSNQSKDKKLNKSTKSAKHSSKLVKGFHTTKTIPPYHTFGENFPFSSIDKEAMIMENQECDKKLKDSFHFFANHVKKNEGAGITTLNKVRGVLINWLKDNEQENLEYNKFMTQTKIKYVHKNKERSETKIKSLEGELSSLKNRKSELGVLLQNGYLDYDVEELIQDIERFSNSWEIRNGKSKKMIEKLAEMKLKLPLVQEYNDVKDQIATKSCEKRELQKVVKGNLQTLGCLSKYYKNMKEKINENN